MIFATCQLQGKSIEQHHDFYTTFVGLTKLPRQSVKRDSGISWENMAIDCQFQDMMTAKVLEDGDPSKAFKVTTESGRTGSGPDAVQHHVLSNAERRLQGLQTQD